MAKTGVLSTKQLAAIDCLLASPSVATAATCANVPLRTIYNWLKDDTFKTALDSAQRQLVSTATRRLAYGLEKSVTTTLHLVVMSEDEPTRLKAAIAVIAMLRDLGEHFDVAQRLAALEAMIAKHTDTTHEAGAVPQTAV